MKEKIHPALKSFIMTDAVKKWDEILKESRGVGIDAGVCFSTANTFCQILEKDLGIPCKIEPVETLIGNDKAKDLFDFYIKEGGDVEAFMTHLSDTINRKGRDNLTPDDPVASGMGIGKEENMFHFVMNLPKQKEVIDLTIGHYKRPQWGIDCENYWSKYDTKGYRYGHLDGEDVWNRSGCVLYTRQKDTPARIGVDPEKYKKEVESLRKYMHDKISKRNIPVFLKR